MRQRGAHPIDSNIRGAVVSTRDTTNDAVESSRILPTKNRDYIDINGNTHVDEAIDVQADDECTVA